MSKMYYNREVSRHPGSPGYKNLKSFYLYTREPSQLQNYGSQD